MFFVVATIAPQRVPDAVRLENNGQKNLVVGGRERKEHERSG